MLSQLSVFIVTEPFTEALLDVRFQAPQVVIFQTIGIQDVHELEADARGSLRPDPLLAVTVTLSSWPA